jgi:hypothetical protein
MATGEVTSAAATAVLGEMRVAGHDDPVVLDALSAAIAKF